MTKHQNTSGANARQVGGTHYVGTFQHWDLAAEYRFGYFEGQITKYTTRFPKKNGLQDAEKGLHFLDKLIELAQQPFPMFMPWLAFRRQGLAVPTHVLDAFRDANGLNQRQDTIIRFVANWRTPADLYCARSELLLEITDLKRAKAIAEETQRQQETQRQFAFGDTDGASPCASITPEEGSLWQHTNGMQYRVRGFANLTSVSDRYPPTVIYEDQEGEVWSRPLADWHRSMSPVGDRPLYVGVDPAFARDQTVIVDVDPAFALDRVDVTDGSEPGPGYVNQDGPVAPCGAAGACIGDTPCKGCPTQENTRG